MKKKHTITENNNIFACIGIGLLVTILISLMMTIALTSLIQKGKISENGNAFIFIIRVTATIVGCLLGSGLSKKSILPVIGAISAGYFIVLLSMGLLFLDGSLNKVWQGILSVIIGGAIACMVKLKPQSSGKKAKRWVK